MMVVRVEIWPGGERGRAQEIARVGIANISDLQPVSDYSVVAVNPQGQVLSSHVRGHRRSLGWIPLVANAISALLVPHKNTTDDHGIEEIITPKESDRFRSCCSGPLAGYIRKNKFINRL